jgi:hypothetical protein
LSGLSAFHSASLMMTPILGQLNQSGTPGQLEYHR